MRWYEYAIIAAALAGLGGLVWYLVARRDAVVAQKMAAVVTGAGNDPPLSLMSNENWLKAEQQGAVPPLLAR